MGEKWEPIELESKPIPEVTTKKKHTNVKFIIKDCTFCEDKNCKMYQIIILNTTIVYISQCRQIKIIEDKTDKDDWWIINLDDFINPKKRKVGDYF